MNKPGVGAGSHYNMPGHTRNLTSDWNLQDWKMTDEVAGVEFAGLENDGVEQEQTYIVHTMKNFNVYDM